MVLLQETHPGGPYWILFVGINIMHTSFNDHIHCDVPPVGPTCWLLFIGFSKYIVYWIIFDNHVHLFFSVGLGLFEMQIVASVFLY